MPHRSEPRFLVLHGLRLKGFAEAAPVAEGAGLDAGEAEELLQELAAEGLVRYRKSEKIPLPPWSLTPEGKAEHGRLIGEDLGASGAKAVVDDAFRRFLEINDELLGVCIDWSSSDHTDPTADREMVERLASLDARGRPITTDLSAHLERFGHYPARLGAALEKVRAGEAEWFTKPMIDSYHTVWFELHEDLMATLGITRGEGEGA